MSPIMAMVIESLVAVLLAVTVGYCIVLDRKLQRLRADEGQMRATVIDLGMATERAERAIDGLRKTLADCDQSLAERLRIAERTTHDLESRIRTGDEVLGRIGRIVNAARHAERAAEGEDGPFAPKLADTVAAAQALAQRIRQRTASPTN
jgi:hypothetical protein